MIEENSIYIYIYINSYFTLSITLEHCNHIKEVSRRVCNSMTSYIYIYIYMTVQILNWGFTLT